MCPTPQQVIEDNSDLLKVFSERYLMNLSIQIQLTEAVARELGDGAAALVESAILEFTRPKLYLGEYLPDFKLQTTIDAAPSLEFLTRYARMVNTRVIPPSVIPSGEVVYAALALFHASLLEPAVV